MVAFGDLIEKQKYYKWADRYVDYNGLKETVEAISKAVKDFSEDRGKEVVIGLCENFADRLDAEIEKCSSHFKEQMEKSISVLCEIRETWGKFAERPSPEILLESYTTCKRLVRHLSRNLKFVELNAEAVRKILKKCDKEVTRSTGFKAFPKGFVDHFIRNRLRPDRTSSLEQLHLVELDKIQLIYIEVHSLIAEMQEIEEAWVRERKVDAEFLFRLHEEKDVTSADGLDEIALFRETSAETAGSRLRADSSGRPVPVQVTMTRGRSGSVLLSQGDGGEVTIEVEDGKAPQLRRQDTYGLLQELRSQAQQTVEKTRLYRWLANEANVDYEREPVGEATWMGLFLNNYNTFLYMSNYYIAIPTAAEYAAAVGLSDTMSGALLAMAPLSSMASSVLYSVWSNRNFKQPLVFCTVILVIGNLLYAAAYDFRSPLMLFVGRLVVGFGGNRAVNRRYIADFTTIESRTFHSAIFVAVGSLGMTLGPGSQVVLDDINFTIPYVNLSVNPMTAPGWVMVVLWIIFFFQTIFGFQEPSRRYARERELLFQGLFEAGANAQQQDVEGGNQTNPSPSAANPGPGLGVSGRSARVVEIPSSGGNKLEEQMGRFGKDWPRYMAPWDLSGTWLCLFLYIVLKAVQEAFQTACPLVTAHYFEWTTADVGGLLALIGIVVLPFNLLIGKLSKKVDDRAAQLFSLFMLAVGCALTVAVDPQRYSVAQYVSGGLVLFIAAQVLEAVNMGLLSKVMPKSLSKGLFNSGFLSTEAGLLGRAFGSSSISLAGLFVSEYYLENAIMIPSIVLIFFSMLLCIVLRNWMLTVSEKLDWLREQQGGEEEEPEWQIDTVSLPKLNRLSWNQRHRKVARLPPELKRQATDQQLQSQQRKLSSASRKNSQTPLIAPTSLEEGGLASLQRALLIENGLGSSRGERREVPPSSGEATPG